MVKMIRELTRRMDAQSEKLEVFNKELEYIKYNHTDQNYNNWNEKYSSRYKETKWYRGTGQQG